MATYTDVDMSLGLHPSTKDVLKKVDLQAAKVVLKNIIKTVPGEKVDDFNYGVGISRMQFEIWTPVVTAFLKRKIIEQVRIYAPEISVQDVSVDTNQDTGELFLTITYYVTGSVALQTFNLVLERTR